MSHRVGGGHDGRDPLGDGGIREDLTLSVAHELDGRHDDVPALRRQVCGERLALLGGAQQHPASRRQAPTAALGQLHGQLGDEILDRLTTPDPAVQKMVDNFEPQPWDPPMKDGRISVPGSDKTISVEDYVRVRYASTWNDDAATTVLGKFKVDGTMSYLEHAESMGARHFNLGDNWGDLQKELGDLTNKQMFELFNKPFLEEALARSSQSKTSFVFSHDPRATAYESEALRAEYDLLYDRGYRMNDTEKSMVKGAGS